MGVNNYQTILRIELNDQMCYSEHHLIVPEHFYCWVAGSFNHSATEAVVLLHQTATRTVCLHLRNVSLFYVFSFLQSSVVYVNLARFSMARSIFRFVRRIVCVIYVLILSTCPRYNIAMLLISRLRLAVNLTPALLRHPVGSRLAYVMRVSSAAAVAPCSVCVGGPVVFF